MIAVRHENRRGGIGAMCLCRKHLRQWKIARQRHNASEFFRLAQAALQRYGPTLGKAGQHDILWRDAALIFPVD